MKTSLSRLSPIGLYLALNLSNLWNVFLSWKYKWATLSAWQRFPIKWCHNVVFPTSCLEEFCVRLIPSYRFQSLQSNLVMTSDITFMECSRVTEFLARNFLLITVRNVVAQTPSRQADTSQTPPRQTDTPLGRQTPHRTATAVDGTHLTGMHSCYFLILVHLLGWIGDRPICTKILFSNTK